MKKIISLSTLLIMLFSVNAQVNPHAIGVRLGSGFGNNYSSSNVELSYQHGLGDAHRIELDLGLNLGISSYNGATYLQSLLSGAYHWDWNIVAGFNWYIGPGAQVGFYSSSSINSFIFGVGGQGGVEYDFNTHGIPILVSLDVRPMYNIGSTSINGMYFTNAGSIRYVF